MFKKTVLPLSNAEKLRNHMSVFHDTLLALEELESTISDNVDDLENTLDVLNQDLSNTRAAIARVKQVTG